MGDSLTGARFWTAKMSGNKTNNVSNMTLIIGKLQCETNLLRLCTRTPRVMAGLRVMVVLNKNPRSLSARSGSRCGKIYGQTYQQRQLNKLVDDIGSDSLTCHPGKYPLNKFNLHQM